MRELEIGERWNALWSIAELGELGEAAAPAVPALERLTVHGEDSLRKGAKAALSKIERRTFVGCL